jgi:hypothetical protein
MTGTILHVERLGLHLLCRFLVNFPRKWALSFIVLNELPVYDQKLCRIGFQDWWKRDGNTALLRNLRCAIVIEGDICRCFSNQDWTPNPREEWNLRDFNPEIKRLVVL